MGYGSHMGQTDVSGYCILSQVFTFSGFTDFVKNNFTSRNENWYFVIFFK